VHVRSDGGYLRGRPWARILRPWRDDSGSERCNDPR
jgi:hypothetical protein